MGLAYGMKRMVDLGIIPTELRVIGGGSKSAVWRQIVADVFGYPTVALKVAEGAALGAAIQAAWTYCQVKGNRSRSTRWCTVWSRSTRNLVQNRERKISPSIKSCAVAKSTSPENWPRAVISELRTKNKVVIP